MRVSHQTTVRFEEGERFEVEATASYSGALVSVRVDSLTVRDDSTSDEGFRITVTGPKVRKDGSDGQWTKDAVVESSALPGRVLADLLRVVGR